MRSVLYEKMFGSIFGYGSSAVAESRFDGERCTVPRENGCMRDAVRVTYRFFAKMSRFGGVKPLMGRCPKKLIILIYIE